MNKEKLDKLIQALIDNPVPMSKFQIENYVVNPQISPVRKIRQLFMEIKTRIQAKESSELALKREILNKELTFERIEKVKAFDDDINLKLLEVDLEEHDITIRNIKINMKHCDIEMKGFLDLLEEADKEYDLEKLMSGGMHDDEVERKYWIERMSRQATLDLLATGTIGVGNMESIISMNKKDQKEIFNLATKDYFQLKSTLQETELKYLPLTKDDKKYLNHQPPIMLSEGQLTLDKNILE
jgi:hypothetical protein